ncbi:snoRNA-binding rRNA-processing protein [Thecaphora frezii]
MPRAPSTAKKGSRGAPSQRHNPLHQELKEDELTSRFGLVSAPGRRSKQKSSKGDDDDDSGAVSIDIYAAPKGMVTGGKAGGGAPKEKRFIDPKLSRNILKLAREQQEELEAEELEMQRAEQFGDGDDNAARASGSRDAIRDGNGEMPEDSDDEDGAAAAADDAEGELDDDEAEMGENGWSSYDANLEIDPSDRALLDKFQAQHATEEDDQDHEMDGDAAAGGGETRRGNKTLADLIMAKIDAAEAAEARRADGNPMPPGINPKVVEVYTKVGQLLSRYKSGPLPKAFKIIPSLPAWESILYITDPASWTPHATLAAVRIFISAMKPSQAEKFLELVLLDKVRDEIQDDGKVSYQTYEAMKKSIYKPAAFFKGFLFPLCESGTLTLKEGAIVSSVLAKVSIPVLHSAAALLRLAEMRYSGPTSLFIRVLLDKKYALPYKVIDALVFHYLRFADPSQGVETDKVTGQKRMPVLWHQSLLVFAQRYKQDLTPDQKGALLDLIRVQRHDGISPEVRRELMNAQARGEMLDEPIDYDRDDDDIMSV